jgi:hypothetical protein
MKGDDELQPTIKEGQGIRAWHASILETHPASLRPPHRVIPSSEESHPFRLAAQAIVTTRADLGHFIFAFSRGNTGCRALTVPKSYVSVFYRLRASRTFASKLLSRNTVDSQ